MSNSKEIKERMTGIRETMKITNAMYLISSSKMKQAKQKLAETEPFFFAMQREISKILSYWPETGGIYFNGRRRVSEEEKKIGIVVITADKGLAGSYNHNVIKAAEDLIAGPGSDRLFVLGEIGRHYFDTHYNNDESGLTIDTDFRYTVQDPNLSRARRIAGRLLELYTTGELDEIHVIYTKMANPVKAETISTMLLPLQKSGFDEHQPESQRIPTFYPSAEDVLNSIVPNYFLGIIYGCLVESYYSEHNARMMAMQNATDSAKDMLDELSMTYNRVRQADITQELTEVCAGAKAQQRK